MDIFPDVKKVPPLPHEKVLRLAVSRIKAGYKPGWLFFKCKEQGLLDIFNRYQGNGSFDILEKGADCFTTPPRLTVELVPRTCWFENIRSNVTKEQWNYLKKKTSEKANRKCEICGGRGPQWPVECHEIWQYDDANHIQRLNGLVALCPSCHEVKHIGFTQLKGKELEATAHLAIVNGWSCHAAEKYIKQAFEVWTERSKKSWVLDISWLSTLGINLPERKKPVAITVGNCSVTDDNTASVETVCIPRLREDERPQSPSIWKYILSVFFGRKA